MEELATAGTLVRDSIPFKSFNGGPVAAKNRREVHVAPGRGVGVRFSFAGGASAVNSFTKGEWHLLAVYERWVAPFGV